MADVVIKDRFVINLSKSKQLKHAASVIKKIYNVVIVIEDSSSLGNMVWVSAEGDTKSVDKARVSYTCFIVSFLFLIFFFRIM